MQLWKFPALWQLGNSTRLSILNISQPLVFEFPGIILRKRWAFRCILNITCCPSYYCFVVSCLLCIFCGFHSPGWNCCNLRWAILNHLSLLLLLLLLFIFMMCPFTSTCSQTVFTLNWCCVKSRFICYSSHWWLYMAVPYCNSLVCLTCHWAQILRAVSASHHGNLHAAVRNTGCPMLSLVVPYATPSGHL